MPSKHWQDEDARHRALRAELQPVLDEKARIDVLERDLHRFIVENESLIHAYAEVLRRVQALEARLERILPTLHG